MSQRLVSGSVSFLQGCQRALTIASAGSSSGTDGRRCSRRSRLKSLLPLYRRADPCRRNAYIEVLLDRGAFFGLPGDNESSGSAVSGGRNDPS
jgi:hypothetical protein